MHIQFDTALILIALASSVVLLLHAGERTLSIVALIAAGIQALIAFGWVSLTISAFRVEIVLAAILAVVGALAWLRTSAKYAVTASTLLAVVGAVELLSSLHLVR